MTPTLAALLAGLGIGLSLIIAIGAQNVFVLRQGLRREHVLAVIIVCAVSDIVLIALGIAGLGALIERLPGLITVVRWLGAAFLVGYGLLAARRAVRAGGGLDVMAQGAVHETAHGTVSDANPAGVARRTASGAELAANAELLADAELAAVAHDSRVISAMASTTTSRTPTTTPTTTFKRIAGRRPASGALAGPLLTVLALTWLNPHVYLDTVFLLGSIANSHGEERWAFGLGAAVGSILWFTALGFGARLLGRLLRTPTAWRIFDGLIAVVMITMGVLLVVPH